MLVKTSVPVACAGTGYIPLGHGKYAQVDEEDLERLQGYHWFAKQSGSAWYAVRKVTSKRSVFFVRMHRQIMHTPKGLVVHHYNGNSLDNHKSNLLNCTKAEHAFYH